ncbi:Uncharacterised protein [Mycobacteroides abscessus subsp. bolletii]|nr:Uncharacterised protein [Mycobacteroides abscessus subsp. bolletii]
MPMRFADHRPNKSVRRSLVRADIAVTDAAYVTA